MLAVPLKQPSNGFDMPTEHNGVAGPSAPTAQCHEKEPADPYEKSRATLVDFQAQTAEGPSDSRTSFMAFAM
jgi:hypothetical protein